MEGHMTATEKIMAVLSLLLMILAIVARSIAGTADIGVLVILAFTGILVWGIVLVCAFFPADWRMTEKQKRRIKNPAEYQNRYRKVLIGLDMLVAILFAVLIWAAG